MEEASKVQQKTVFTLSDWLRTDDLFDYRMTPQFLSRFDTVALLNELTEEDLVEIFLEAPDGELTIDAEQVEEMLAKRRSGR